MKNFISASLILVTLLFIVACIIFWLNIKKDPDTVSRGFGQMVAASNEGINIGYKLTDELYMAAPDSADGELYAGGIFHYEQNIYPYCFVCGWNVGKSGPFILMPHKKDDIIYSGDSSIKWTGTDYDRNDYGYYMLDTRNWKFSFVASAEELNEKGFPMDLQYRMKFSDFQNSEVLTFDNESCFVVISAFLLIYIILLPSCIIIKIRDKVRKKM